MINTTEEVIRQLEKENKKLKEAIISFLVDWDTRDNVYTEPDKELIKGIDQLRRATK